MVVTFCVSFDDIKKGSDYILVVGFAMYFASSRFESQKILAPVFLKQCPCVQVTKVITPFHVTKFLTPISSLKSPCPYFKLQKPLSLFQITMFLVPISCHESPCHHFKLKRSLSPFQL